jgi:hypothetical protein
VDLGIPPPKVRAAGGAAVTDAIGRDMPRYAGYLGHEIRSPIPGTSGSPVPRSREDGPQGSSDAGSVQHHLEHDSQECGDRKSGQEERSWSPGRLPVDSTIFSPVPPAGIEPATRGLRNRFGTRSTLNGYRSTG